VRRIVLATRNPGKLLELHRILGDAGLDVELAGMDAFPDVPDVAETGVTFLENAMLKARAVYEATGELCVADDSGLAVDALNGMPGVLSARWAGRHGDDQANLDLLLAQLSDVPDERRGATFVCVAAAVGPDGAEAVAEGRMEGFLIRDPRGTNGFGYDPIFVARGHEMTTGQMASADKDAISHRGKAFRAIAPMLAKLLDG
jgi:XTP/dITP diphosphohydrolase